jgi:eukaryotic-like serine/threonine-protein kinase
MITRPDRWNTVEGLYHAALARPVDERATFLAEACAGDEGLRREVESLLASRSSKPPRIESAFVQRAQRQ